MGRTGEAAHPDWNIRGRSGPGLELQGLDEDEEAAAARDGKENVSKGWWRERTRRTGDGKREEKEKKDKRMEPGLEHLGKTRGNKEKMKI